LNDKRYKRKTNFPPIMKNLLIQFNKTSNNIEYSLKNTLKFIVCFLLKTPPSTANKLSLYLSLNKPQILLIQTSLFFFTFLPFRFPSNSINYNFLPKYNFDVDCVKSFIYFSFFPPKKKRRIKSKVKCKQLWINIFLLYLLSLVLSSSSDM
jgi:hypothetical protein